MSTATRNCQNHVQRLRSRALATLLPGSQMPDPRTLRPERLKWLSIPFPFKSRRRKTSVRGRGCWMGSTDTAKSWPAAQIAAFLAFAKANASRRSGGWWTDLFSPSLIPHAEVLRVSEASKHGQLARWRTLRGPLAGAPQGEGVGTSTRRAFAHHIPTLFFDGRKGQGSAGTDPSTLFRICEVVT